MDRCEAVEAGIKIGRARRRPSTEENLWARSLGMESALERGIARGLKLAGKLDQIAMDLGV